MKFAIQDHQRLVLHASPNAQGFTVGVLRGDADHDSLNVALADFNREINTGPQRQRKPTVELAKERFAEWLRPSEQASDETDKATPRMWRVYEAYENAVGGVEGCGTGSEEIEADTAEQAAREVAAKWQWDAPSWDGGDVIVATDDDGESYHLHREAAQ